MVSTASPSYSQSYWVPPVAQQSGPAQRNQLQDTKWELKPVSYPSISVRNEEVPVSVAYSHCPPIDQT